MTNNKQQTAVEWLQSIELERDLTLADWKQAKEMEKERMIEFAQSYAVIHCMGDITKNADEYYNETYGGGEQ
jgi:uncharacterized protein YhaN